MKDSKIVAKRVISIANGGTVERWYNNDGKLHRDGDLPAVIGRYANGQKYSECWCKDGKDHRDGDLPATINYRENGKKHFEFWRKDGEPRRDGGKPTAVHYPETEEPVATLHSSVEDRLAKLEATMAKLAAAFTEKQ